MRKLLPSLLFLALLGPAYAQSVNAPVGPGARPTACAAFGTTAGTCAQGDDSRITGAAQQTQSSTTYTATDQSGAALTFTGVSTRYTVIGNMIYVYGTLTYPATADTNPARISLPVNVPDVAYASTLPVNIVLGSALAFDLIGYTRRNTTTFGIQNAASSANVTNAQLSGVSIFFMAIYPVQ